MPVEPSESPLVSVVVVTYNHERYLRQALDSVLGQVASFDFEVIVSEDCSTDGTAAIVREYMNQWPGRLTGIFSAANTNSNEVTLRAIRQARGRYIAILDGDDYWSSPDKLAIQASLLEARPDHSMCFHRIAELDETRGSTTPIPEPVTCAQTLQLADMLMHLPVSGCSSMIRASCLQPIPAWVLDAPVCDWPLYAIAASQGPVSFIEKPLGVYRIHSGGYWSGASRIRQTRIVIAMLWLIRDHLPIADIRGSDHGLAFHYAQLGIGYRATNRAAEEVCSRIAAIAAGPRSLRFLAAQIRGIAHASARIIAKPNRPRRRELQIIWRYLREGGALIRGTRRLGGEFP